MFRAAPHRFLVPFDGTFKVAKSSTKPPDKAKKSAKKAKQPSDWNERLAAESAKLGDSQHRLYSRATHSVLVVLQALDAGGKDGVIRHVFDAVNPCGLQVASFKAPTPLEASHDFLWRTTAHLPARGHVAVFNRSYYEEVLVVRVHPEFLAAQQLTEKTSTKLWKERFRAIAEHELSLAREGTLILKFWLNVSKKEQRTRLLERIDDPEKRWKFRMGDIDEREYWSDYLRAYQDCLNATSRPWAPWYAIPADDKHFARWQIAKLVNDAFDDLELAFPEPTDELLDELEQARKRLQKE
jgi:PPK2 family polyphosphate:nucleotide phosphotransferase